VRILILCTGNSCRSQIAQTLLQSFDKNLYVRSAGTKIADKVNPYAIEVLKEHGFDISGRCPVDVRDYLNEKWNYVITVCDGAKESCPNFTGEVSHKLHISFPDPADATGNHDEILNVFRAVFKDIKEKFYEFYLGKCKEE